MNLLSMLFISMAIALFLVIFNMISSNLTPNADKVSPYECGFDPMNGPNTQMSIQFFLVAILFLIFDLEIALLLPLPWAMLSNTPKMASTTATMILILLTLGLAYEWCRGGLDWAK
uniref:NADH-ubiquinone oxidoreductase chain 3 n=1 Tax=Indotyphlops braminus TaxID=51846 RepID=A9X4F9_9SAUR|nr:NADH dehydrogenase subunit 3 [Indotyphlops braminus]ABC55924.1 NADH dehydrogenase subunit 3 [Indotyphlops braminus]